MSVSGDLRPSFHAAIAEIDRAEWDHCAGDDCVGGGNPFVAHDFLSALEDSGAVSPTAGWGPRHLALRDAAGRLVGAVPLYLKSHSLGEYVFDQAWADAYMRAGGRYYPKLLAAVPFTPVTGPRLLAAPEAPGDVRESLARAAAEFAEEHGLSSLHVNFITAQDRELLARTGFLLRADTQFHWENEGYGSFEDFLASLSSRKRKAIRRERRDALADGITVEIVTGADLREEHWDAFFAFYMDTGSRKWGRPYLNRLFFSLLGERMADRVVLILARRAGRYIAGALNLEGGGMLYGRYWGAIEHHPFLHFELCYYQAMEYAIARGLRRVEAGAQGEHKLMRGYLPNTTWSAHWICDPGFRAAVARFLAEERRLVAQDQRILSEYAPFRKD